MLLETEWFHRREGRKWRGTRNDDTDRYRKMCAIPELLLFMSWFYIWWPVTRCLKTCTLIRETKMEGVGDHRKRNNALQTGGGEWEGKKEEKRKNKEAFLFTDSLHLFPTERSFGYSLILLLLLPLSYWECWLLQYVVFLLHLSQNYKCTLAVWSRGVTCIRFLTHKKKEKKSLNPESAICLCADSTCINICVCADSHALIYVCVRLQLRCFFSPWISK